MSDASGPGLSPEFITFSVDGQDTKREFLLGFVTVNDEGVLECANPFSGSVVSVLGVRIDDNLGAEALRFEAADSGLVLPMPADRPSKFGFFIGYEHGAFSELVMGAALRTGEYPGDPTIYQDINSSGRVRHEIMLSLNGVKASDDPKKLMGLDWARQLGLYEDFGFIPGQVRGHFERYHRIGSSEDWDTQPFIYEPDSIDGVAVESLGTNVVQLLGYSYARVPVQTIEDWLSKYAGHDVGYDRQVRSFGVKAASPMRAGSIGLGASHTTSASTGKMDLRDIVSAAQFTIES